MKERRRIPGLWACAAVLLTLSVAAPAALVLEDTNSQVRIDPNSDAGMYDWTVEGVGQLARQWFWVRVGDTAPEQGIHTLSAPLITLSDTNPFDDSRNDTAHLVYESITAGLRVEVNLGLDGGPLGTGTSDIGETISLRNISGAAMVLHFFQYTDLDLGGDASDDTLRVFLDGANGFNRLEQLDAGSAWMSETVASITPDHYEVGEATGMLARLNDGAPILLADTVGPYTGNAAAILQWTFALNDQQEVVISKDKHITPEPGMMALLAAGVPLLLRRRGRR